MSELRSVTCHISQPTQSVCHLRQVIEVNVRALLTPLMRGSWQSPGRKRILDKPRKTHLVGANTIYFHSTQFFKTRGLSIRREVLACFEGPKRSWYLSHGLDPFGLSGGGLLSYLPRFRLQRYTRLTYWDVSLENCSLWLLGICRLDM